MSKEGGSGRDNVVVWGSHYERPKSIIEAISELEQYSAVLPQDEEDSIPEQFFTFKQKLEFFGVGFRDSFISGIVSAIFTPISFGVVRKLIPIFGNYEPSLFDKFFAFMLTLSFSVGYAILIAVLLARHYYRNRIIRSAINNFLSGLYTGKFFAVSIAFIGFHFLYFFTNENIVSKLVYKFFERADVRYEVYKWVMDFKEVFIEAAWFLVFAGVLFVIIPSVALLYYRFRRRELISEEEI